MLCCAPRTLDLRLAIALDPEDRIRLGFWWAAEKRVDVFPDNAAFWRHLEEAPEYAFVDQRIAVRHAHGVRDTVAEERLLDTFLEFPGDRVRRRVDFED